jgi:hypothetical protein
MRDFDPSPILYTRPSRSFPEHDKVPSSSGLGHHPLKVGTRVQIPLGLLLSSFAGSTGL